MFDGRWEAQLTIPAGGATITATNSGGSGTAVTVAAGTYTISSLVTALLAALTATRPPSAGAWTVTLSTGAAGTGRVTINCAGSWSIAWGSGAGLTLRSLLGFAANTGTVSSAQTGAAQAKGLWFPDCPLMLDSVPGRAPRVTDRRGSESPLGIVYTLVGNAKYEHKNLTYQAVPLARVFEADATYDNASYEMFLIDTQDGAGHEWFVPGSPVRIWDHTGAELGGGAVDVWYLHELPAIGALTQLQRGWLGLWTLIVPRLTGAI